MFQTMKSNIENISAILLFDHVILGILDISRSRKTINCPETTGFCFIIHSFLYYIICDDGQYETSHNYGL